MSVRHEVLQVLGASSDPIHSVSIFEKCEEASGRPIVSQTLSLLKNEKLVKPAGKSLVEGEEQLVLWEITAAGRAELKDLAEGEKASGWVAQKPGDREGGRAGRRESGKSKRRAKGKHKKSRKHGSGRVHKVQRKTATSRRHGQRGPRAAPAALRWALTSEGSFILLGTEIEIPRAAARPLIELVRRAGGAIQTASLFAELAAFIEKLDQGRA